MRISKPENSALLLILAVQVMAIGKMHAQEHASVPTYHWSYDYAYKLALRHREAGITFDHVPLSAATMRGLAGQTQAFASSAAEKFWLTRLNEFTFTPSEQRPWLQLGARFRENAGKFDTKWRAYTGLRTYLGIFPDKHVSLVNAIRLDEELRDDPTYLGKRWRGFNGYTEQAYAQLHFGKYLIKFGRDFVRWGSGADATLLLSDESRPLDQFFACLDLKRIRLHYLAARLNPTALPDSLVARSASGYANRYLSALRAEFVVNPRWLTMAVTQMVLYGGPDRGFEWYYLNPFLVFHGEQLNEERKGNALVALDLILRPRDTLRFYGQLLIDDVQVEYTRRGDLEPDQIAYLIGGEMADPLKLAGVSFGVEYTRVANRTYNTIASWEKFTHRNRPLAHFLGNDFDRWLLQGRAYAGRAVELALAVEFRRRGEGRIDSTYDAPWLNSEVTDSYQEKFPSGLVEHSTHWRFEARWHPRTGFYLALGGEHARYRDFENQAGVKKNDTRFTLNLWWEKMWWLGLD